MDGGDCDAESGRGVRERRRKGATLKRLSLGPASGTSDPTLGKGDADIREGSEDAGRTAGVVAPTGAAAAAGTLGAAEGTRGTSALATEAIAAGKPGTAVEAGEQHDAAAWIAMAIHAAGKREPVRPATFEAPQKAAIGKRGTAAAGEPGAAAIAGTCETTTGASLGIPGIESTKLTAAVASSSSIATAAKYGEEAGMPKAPIAAKSGASALTAVATAATASTSRASSAETASTSTFEAESAAVRSSAQTTSTAAASAPLSAAQATTYECASSLASSSSDSDSGGRGKRDSVRVVSDVCGRAFAVAHGGDGGGGGLGGSGTGAALFGVVGDDGGRPSVAGRGDDGRGGAAGVGRDGKSGEGQGSGGAGGVGDKAKARSVTQPGTQRSFSPVGRVRSEESDEATTAKSLEQPPASGRRPSVLFRKSSIPDLSGKSHKFQRQLSEEDSRARRGSLGTTLAGKFLLPVSTSSHGGVAGQPYWGHHQLQAQHSDAGGSSSVGGGGSSSNLVRMRNQALGQSAPSLTASLFLSFLADARRLYRKCTCVCMLTPTPTAAAASPRHVT